MAKRRKRADTLNSAIGLLEKEISRILSQEGRPSVTIVIKMIVFGKGLKGNGGRNIEVWSSANKFEYLPVEDGESGFLQIF